MNSQGKVRAMELVRQCRERDAIFDPSPSRFIQLGVTRVTNDFHPINLPVPQNDKLYRYGPLFQLGQVGFRWYELIPIFADGLEHLRKIRPEISDSIPCRAVACFLEWSRFRDSTA